MSAAPIPTKERLALVLEEAGLKDLASLARFGRFDDFESESTTPIIDLVVALRARRRRDLAERAMNGEWDCTPEEAEAWADSPEGRRVVAGLPSKQGEVGNPLGVIAAAYWNGERCAAERILAEVGPSEVPTWWCAGLVGTHRVAIEVRYGSETFYLDDEDGTGTYKVTLGRGSPRCSHKSLPVVRVVKRGTAA